MISSGLAWLPAKSFLTSLPLFSWAPPRPSIFLLRSWGALDVLWSEEA